MTRTRWNRWIALSITLVWVFSGAEKVQSQATVANRNEIRAMSHAEQIEQLRDDDIRFNAFHAVMSLYEWMNEETIVLLEQALDSDCWQQRQLSAWLLRKEPRYEISERLVEVTVEGLRCDNLPYERRPDGTTRYTPFFNAADGVRYLIALPLEYPQPLLDALDSDDRQQRFYSAYILGAHGWEDDRQRLVEKLATHLRDDDVRYNAQMACYAIYHLGPEARPLLIQYRDSEDAQKRKAVELILHNWERPPQTLDDRIIRSGMHNLSYAVNDPTVEAIHYNRVVHFPVDSR